MKIEFLFNSTSKVILIPESDREKTCLKLFEEASKAGIITGPSPHGQPDILVLQSNHKVEDKGSGKASNEPKEN